MRDQWGEKNPSYKDGRKAKLKDWIFAVLERDGFICQDCKGSKEVLLNRRISAHHIKSKKVFPELKYLIDNGITLCNSCHTGRHNKERIGIPLSESHKIKLSESWNSPGFAGHHHNLESRKKISETLHKAWKKRNHIFSEEHKNNLKIAWEKRRAGKNL